MTTTSIATTTSSSSPFVPYSVSLAHLRQGGVLYTTCPDGVERPITYYNSTTSDLVVKGWQGNVWADCSDGTLRVDFEQGGRAA